MIDALLLLLNTLIGVVAILNMVRITNMRRRVDRLEEWLSRMDQ